MKKIYLDTNIYNKLLDFVNERKIGIEKLSQKIISNSYIIPFNPIIFEEFAHTVKQSPERTVDLFKLSYKICSKDHIIKIDLIRDDLRCFLENNREDSPFVKGEERQEFIRIWGEATEPDTFKDMPQNLFDEFRKEKKDSLAFYK